MTKQTTDELVAEMFKKPVPDPVTGMVYFDGGTAWKEFSKQMIEDTGPGKLVDDFDEQ